MITDKKPPSLPQPISNLDYLLFSNKETPKTAFIIDKIKLKNNAHQKPLTSNPGTISAASKIISALITKRNNPKVNMVMGIVRIIKIGFIV